MAEVIILPASDAADHAAAHLTSVIRDTPDVALGLATGSSPLALYRALAARIGAEGVAVDRVRGFALDEYVGLPAGHPESYRAVIEREVARPLGLTPSLVHVPDGDLAGIQTAGERYEELLRASGGVDAQILGIGTDGHVGFNEPGSSLASLTRVKTLTAQTRRDNARFFATPEEVPHHCVTQGIGTILRAKHLLLFASGEAKADAIARAVEGPVSASCPGSAIQLHPHVTVYVDDAAAARLQGLNYYRETFAAKPEWQGI